MEKLTVSEVTDLLCAEGIPDSLLTILAGMSYYMHKFVHMYIHMWDNYIFTENHIDGIALVALPEDWRIQAPNTFKRSKDAY